MKIALLLYSLSLLVGDPAQTEKLQELDWLVGTWEMKTSEGAFTEQWRLVNDTTISGTGFFITPKGDTAFRESLSIVDRNGFLYYVPVIENQNDGKPVYFKEKARAVGKSKGKMITFENSQHDFPQQIIYTAVSDNNIIAKVSGVQKGKERTEEFNMTRVNDK